MKNIFTLILLTFVSTSIAAQTTEPLKVTVVSTSAEEHHRIPSIVKLANGNLMAFYYLGANNSGEMAIVL